MTYEINQHSKFYFVYSGFTQLAGPFKQLSEAKDWVSQNDWKDRMNPIQDKLHKIFMDACDRWSDPEEVMSYLEKIKGKLLVGKSATNALSSGKKGHVVFDVVDETPFVESSFDPEAWVEPMSPAAIVLPEEIALKIVALGMIP